LRHQLKKERRQKILTAPDESRRRGTDFAGKYMPEANGAKSVKGRRSGKATEGYETL